MPRRFWSAAVAGTAAMIAVFGVQGSGGSMDSLVKAERAFARMSVKTSQREAFLANFADDGVWFTPGPANTKEALRKQPAPAGPPARTLDWEPSTGDVAASGDLGYTTGPYVSTPRAADAPPRTGWFFSVWRWRSDTQWKVAADFGVEAPAAGLLRPRPFSRADARSVSPKVKPGAAAVADELRAADAAYAADVCAGGLQMAYRTRAAKDLLVFRPGSALVGGRLAVIAIMPSGPASFTLEPMHAEASRAGDLGFTYGSYAFAANRGPETRGYYLHVWKRLADGWMLAADVTNR